jgi:hypothetical protein
MKNQVVSTQVRENGISATFRKGLLPDGKPIDQILAHAEHSVMIQFHQLAVLLGYELVDCKTDPMRPEHSACLWAMPEPTPEPIIADLHTEMETLLAEQTALETKIADLQRAIRKAQAVKPVTVVEVILDRAEGPTGLCKAHSFPTLAEANSVLKSWAWAMPTDRLGYDKIDFEVHLSNGDCYEGRFDLEPRHRMNANIIDHIVGYLTWVSKNGKIMGEEYAATAKNALPLYRSFQ